MNFLSSIVSRKFFVGGVLCALLVIGFAVRFVYFDEWLYFKTDQARDAMLVSTAVENGLSHLPLLGPRVGAVELTSGLLRVGPIYYYFQYISGRLFHSVDPSVFAYPDLFFGVAAIPMLFFLVRLAFSASTSLLITTLFSFSFLAIQYSRFAWNPNPLPCFLFLSFYGLLRFLRETSVKKRLLWVALWAIGGSVAIQLHFFGTFSLIGISGLVLLWHFEAWKMAVLRSVATKKVFLPILRYLSVALVVFSVFSVPIIINDVLRQGENTRNFFEALTSKPDSKHSLVEKFSEAIYQNGRYLCLVSTATCTSGKIEKIAFPLTATALFLLASLCALIARLRSTKSDAERDFLRLTLVWLIVFFILSIPVAFQLRPRFFLVVIAIPFFLWAILFEYLRDRWSHRGTLVGLTVFILLLGLNIYGTAMWFQEQSLSQEKGASIDRTLILKNKDGVTLGQLQRASEVLAKAVRKDERIYFFVKPEHIAPVEYLLRQERRRNPELVFENMEKWNDRFEQDPKARFFALVNVEQTNLDAVAKKFEKSIEVLSVKPCGQIAAVEFRVLDRVIDPSFQQEIQPQKPITEKKPGGRVFWGDVFGFETSASVRDEVENKDATISEE